MTVDSSSSAVRATGDIVPFAVLWLAGVCLRLTVMVIPPIVPLLHADLRLSETQVGLLSALPSLMFAIAAIPGAALIGRFGIRATLIAGMVVCALASAARGAIHDVGFLYTTTIVMAAGIAIMQPALPPLVRARFPARLGFATAVYMNGLLVGEILAVSLTIPVVLPLVDNRWSGSLVVWAIPVLLTAVLVLAIGKRLFPDGDGGHPSVSQTAVQVGSWLPDFRNPLIWRLGFMLGGVNALYFVANAFLPDFTTAAGHPELVGEALTALNLSQLPASLLMLVFAGKLAGRRWAYIVLAVVMFCCVFALMGAGGSWIVVWAAIIGFCDATALVLVFALPVILSAPGEVHRTSAGMFTISYSWAMLVSVGSGLVWDWTRSPLSGIAPLALCALLIAGLAATLERRA